MVWIYSASLTAGAWGWSLTAAVFLAMLAVVPFLERDRRRRFVPAWSLAAVCFCYGLLFTHASHRDIDRTRTLSRQHPEQRLTGRVAGYPEHRLGGVRFPFETTVEGQRTTLLVSTVAFGLEYGDSLCLTGKLSVGRRDRTGNLVSRGASGYFRARGAAVMAGAGLGASVRRWAWRSHESIRRTLARELGARCGLPMALAIGERGWIRNRTKDHFVHLGISHLLALSGMHLGLIAGLIVSAMRAARIRNRVVLLAVLTAYVLVVGEVVSLYRAYAMAGFLVLAVTVERPARLTGALGAALFLLLLLRPGLAYSVAFQLSFSATLAVVMCVTRIRLPGKPSGWGKRIGAAALGTLVVGACVQVFLLPMQLAYFGRVSVLTPAATLVFLPVTAAVMFATGVALAVGGLAPGASSSAFTVVGAMAHGFEWALAAAATWAPATVEAPKPNVVLYYTGQAVLWLGLPRGLKAALRRRWVIKVVRVATGAAMCLAAFVPFHRFF
jgi:competence protein ComEC